jgi:hypothetical protein
MISRTGLVVACALAIGRPSVAGTIYVNNITGDDRANGAHPDIKGLRDGPVRTIRRGLELVEPYGGLVIAHTDLPYAESMLITRVGLSGTRQFPFIVEGNGATLRGAERLPADVWRRVGPGTYRYQPYRKGHYQLVVGGAVADAVAAAGADAPPLEPLQWAAVHGLVHFRVEPGKFIDQYEFEAPAREVGLGLHNARNVIVRNLRIELFRLDGIAVTGNSRNIRLENIRSTANGRSGLAVSGTSEVQVGRIDLAGNRVSDRLVQRKGRVYDLPDAEVPPPPAPQAWDLDSGRYVRILSPDAEQRIRSTAERESAGGAVRR